MGLWAYPAFAICIFQVTDSSALSYDHAPIDHCMRIRKVAIACMRREEQ